MPTCMLVTQSERFSLNNNLICRAIIINPCCFVISSDYVMNTTGTWVQDILFFNFINKRLMNYAPFY
jgi:hypothetical protein